MAGRSGNAQGRPDKGSPFDDDNDDFDDVPF
jgi:hypothetical protein